MGAGIPEDFLRNVVEDDSPRLGGNLDVNGNTITSASDGDIRIFPDGTGGVYISSNLGIGTNPSDDRINLYHAPIDDTAAYGFKLLYTPSTTVDASQSYRAMSIASSPSITAGKTNTSETHALFTSILGASGFQGNMNIMYGHENRFGLYTGATGTVSTCYGLRMLPYIKAGTIDNLFNIYIDGEVTGGTLTNPYYSIKDMSNGSWWLAQDDKTILLGGEGDASIYYDGTDLVLNPKVVGSGNVHVLGSIDVDTTVFALGGSFTNFATTNVIGSLVPVATTDLGSLTNRWGGLFLADDAPVEMGDAQDATVYYNGQDMVIDPREVGTGHLLLCPNQGSVGIRVAAPIEALDVAGHQNFDTIPDPTLAQVQAVGLAEDSGAGSLAAGEYFYDIYFVCEEGHSAAGEKQGYGNLPSLTVSANASVDITGIPISPDPRVTARVIMRSDTDGLAFLCKKIYILNDNTTTSWTDDGSLSQSGVINYRFPNTSAGFLYVNGEVNFSSSRYNVFAGAFAGNVNEGYDNVGIGPYAGRLLTSGVSSTAVGSAAGSAVTTGSNNTFLGYRSGVIISTGGNNVFVGVEAGDLYSTGFNVSNSVAVGWRSLSGGPGSAQNGNNAFGHETGYNFGGAYNIFMGYQTGKIASRIDASSYNILLGYQVGTTFGTGADYNILMGYNIEPDNTTGSYQLNIGNIIKGDATSGSEYLSLPHDEPFYFGVTKDASLTYDGTDLVINPLEQGTGFLKLLSPFEIISGTTGGHKWNVAEATVTLSGATTDIQVNVPSGAKVLGCQLRVDTAITSGDGGTDWDADYTGGSSQPIGATLALAKQTKKDTLYDTNAASPIASAEIDVRCTCNAGTFNGGVVRAIVYYEELDTMADAA